MIEFLHALIYQNPRNYGSLIFMGSCRIDFTNSRSLDCGSQITAVGMGCKMSVSFGVHSGAVAVAFWTLQSRVEFQTGGHLMSSVWRNKLCAHVWSATISANSLA